MKYIKYHIIQWNWLRRNNILMNIYLFFKRLHGRSRLLRNWAIVAIAKRVVENSQRLHSLAKESELGKGSNILHIFTGRKKSIIFE